MSEKISNAEKSFITAQLLLQKKNLCCYSRCFYEYNGKIWESVSQDYAYSIFQKEFMQNFSGFPTKTIKKEIEQFLITESVITYGEPLLKEKNKNEINLKENIFELKKYTERKYTKEDFKMNILNFSYNKEKEKKPNAPRFKQFLIEIMGCDKIDDKIERQKRVGFILEWMGYSLLSSNPLQKALIMYGNGRNGKGKLMNIWELIVGKSNVSNLDLKSIDKPEYAVVTKDKLINFSSDLSKGQQLDTGTIKAAVAGEKIEGKILYQQPFFFDFSAKLIILANNLPYLSDVSVAIKERFHLLPFNESFINEKADNDIDKKLKGEVEDIFHLALIGLKRLLKRGKFDLPEIVKNAQKSFYLKNDSISLWISQKEDKKIDNSITTSKIYREYKSFCSEWGKKAKGKQNFFSNMENKGYKRERGYLGHYYFIKK